MKKIRFFFLLSPRIIEESHEGNYITSKFWVEISLSLSLFLLFFRLAFIG